MIKKITTILAVVAITVSLTGNALAALADLELIRVVYERTTGTTEQLTDMGVVTNLLVGTHTIAGDALSATNANNLFVTYFAINKTTNELWVSNSTTVAPVAVGVNGFNSTKSGVQSVYTYYNLNVIADANGVLTGSQSYPSSFRLKLDASQGAFANAITIVTRTTTEASLAYLVGASSGSVTQYLYYIVNGNTAGSVGVPVATITTNADGSTTIDPISNSSQSQTISMINFSPSILAVGGTTTASATATSGLAVTFNVAAASSGICSISGTTVTGLATGTCTITADQAGNASYSPAPQVTQNITVTAPGPVVSFSSPPPSTSSSATVSLSFSATPNPDGYMITDTSSAPLASDTGWVANPPTSYTFLNIPAGVATAKVLYVWAKDTSNRVSPLPGTAQVTITIPALTVTIVNNLSDISNNSGGGHIISAPAVIDCSVNSCTVPVDPAVIPGPVTLTAYADTNSSFTGWSNNINCIGTGTCTPPMSTSQNVSATFDRLKLIRSLAASTPKAYYGLVQNAFSAAVNGDVIQVTQNIFNEDVLLNQVNGTDNITLNGGYNSVFGSISGVATIQGKLTIQSGCLNVSGVVVK